MSKRIWNEEELKSMAGFRYLSFLGWRKLGESYYLLPEMVGKTLSFCKEAQYNVQDWMIATTDDKPHLGNSDYVAHFKGEDKPQTQNNMKTVKLNNGTILEVGKKYRRSDWKDDVFIDIKCIDEDDLFGRDNNGYPCVYDINTNWLPYTAPQEEVKWKTFLIEFRKGNFPKRAIMQYESQIQAMQDNPNFESITEVEIEIKEK